MAKTTLLAIAFLAWSAGASRAQQHVHQPGMTNPDSVRPARPTQAGQAAFGALVEVVRLLEEDPTTDWTQVDIEKLRLHLVDMDLVTMRSAVRKADVAGGAQFEIRGGDPTTVAAIQRMAIAHGVSLQREFPYDVVVKRVEGGADMTVTLRGSQDARGIAKIRGLGFVGLLALGGHHGPHHLMIARGSSPH